ncbi:MAG TPA: hypothetical protein DCK78_14480 [Paenibacillus lactis]|nr:hypothetical protein [Paenibacillus lactis]
MILSTGEKSVKRQLMIKLYHGKPKRMSVRIVMVKHNTAVNNMIEYFFRSMQFTLPFVLGG